MTGSRKKKILFFGLGSIGLRHAALLRQHFDVELAAYRTRTGGGSPDIVEYHDLEEAFRFKPDIAFITNPTSCHVETARACAEKGIHLFIEKPVSHTTAGLDELQLLVDSNNLHNYVAFCLRFHPVIQWLKAHLEVADVVYARSICSSYFPLWRPGQDYRENYSAKREMGGGVQFEMIHDPDYNEYLFGRVTGMDKQISRLSGLDITSDDLAELHMTHESGVRTHVSLDSFSHKRERSIRVYTAEKVFAGDIIQNTITVFRDYKETDRIALEPADFYHEQLKHFMNMIEKEPAEHEFSLRHCRNLVQLISDE